MAEVDNKQILFKGYIERTPEETDMEIKVTKIKLEAPKGSGAFLVKNLYLSCDPYMRGRMRDVHDSYIPPFVPGQVTPLSLMFFLLFTFPRLYNESLFKIFQDFKSSIFSS
jgi:NADPH-dependent curcumin reductase CurA